MATSGFLWGKIGAQHIVVLALEAHYMRGVRIC